MKYSAKVDDNQAEIVRALEQIGCSVQSLAMVGQGCPDLLVGYRGQNILMEIKDGNKPPSRRKLNEKQVDWHQSWRGTAYKVTSVEDATQAIKLELILLGE